MCVPVCGCSCMFVRDRASLCLVVSACMCSCVFVCVYNCVYARVSVRARLYVLEKTACVSV